MNDSLLCAPHRLNGAPDKVFAARREDLEPHVVGDSAGSFNQSPSEVEVGLRGGRERDLDFLVANSNEHLEHAPFLIAVLEFCERAWSESGSLKVQFFRLGEKIPWGQPRIGSRLGDL